MDNKERKIGGFYPLKPEADVFFRSKMEVPVFRSGRDTLRWIKRKKNIKHILLPSFICEDVINVFQDIDIDFYNSDVLFIDIDKIKKYMNKLKRDSAVLFVNYFGFPSPLRDYPWTEDIIVIEDSIGSYFLSHNKMSVNYFNIVGIRKIFPVGYGAMIFGCDEYFNLEKWDDFYSFYVSSFIKSIKGNEDIYLDLWQKAETIYDDNGTYLIGEYMSSVYFSIDKDIEKKKRIENYKYLLEFIKGFSLDKNVVPLYFLIKYDKNLYDFLQKRQIFAAILWKNTENKYIGLPISGYYNIEDMRIIINVLKEYKYEGLY